jgi:hypothetical protein
MGDPPAIAGIIQAGVTSNDGRLAASSEVAYASPRGVAQEAQAVPATLARPADLPRQISIQQED